MSRIVYMDGKFLPEAEAKISIYDLSVMQAAAAFEMTRSFHGHQFKLIEHLERLEQSCHLLSIPFPFDKTDLIHLCHTVSAENDHGPSEEHRLLIVVSPGCAPMYNDLEGVIPHPFVYIADFPLSVTTRGMGKYFRDGVELSWSAVRQIPSSCIPSQAKHRGRTAFHLAQVQATANTWPLMLDVTGTYVTECPGANIITVHKNRVYCANYEALPGISQQTIADLMSLLGYSVIHGRLAVEDILQAEEVWISGTPFCALPVVSLDGQPIGDGTIGPRYKELMSKWNELVGLDIQQQIVEWDKQCLPV